MPLNTLVQFLPLVVLLIFCPLVIFSMLAFDRLVRIEHNEFPEAWAADGKPYPSWRRGPDMRITPRSWFATIRGMFVWLFVTPLWARGHSEASYYLRRMRIFVALWNFVAMPLFILSALIAIAFGG